MSTVRRNMLWMAASQGCAFVTQFVTTVVLARLLTPYEMGVFAAALAVVGLLVVLRNIGLGSYVVRAVDLTPAILRTTFTVNALLSLLIAGAVAGLSVLGGAVLGEPGVRDVLLLIAVVPLLSIFEFRPSAVLERLGQFRSIAGVNALRALTGGGVAIGLALDGHSYMSLAYGQLAGGVVGMIGVNLAGRRHASLRMGLADWRDALRYGMHMLAIGGIAAATSRLAELALARMLGLGALGMYSRATGVANLVWENVQMVIVRTMFVDLAEQRREGRSLRHSYLRVVALMTALLWPVFVGLAVLSGPVVMLLYGAQWVRAALPLSLLSLSFLPLAAMVMATGIMQLSERTAEQARLDAIRSAVGLAMFLGGSLVSIDWAAASRIGEAALAFLLFRPWVQRMTDTREADYTPIYLRSLALTVAAVVPAAAVMAWFDWNPQAPLLPLLGAVLAGGVLWAGLLLWMRHPLLDEARWLLGRFGRGPAAR